MSRLAALPLAFTVLAACADSPVAPADELTPQFGASVFHLEAKVPVASWWTFIPCANGGAGETATVTDALLHVVIRYNVDAAGGVHYTAHNQPMGNWDGIGDVTGDVYQATGVTKTTSNWDGVDGLPWSYTVVNNYRWIGPGPGNNLLIHAVTHITYNANGEWTADVVHSSSECK